MRSARWYRPRLAFVRRADDRISRRHPRAVAPGEPPSQRGGARTRVALCGLIAFAACGEGDAKRPAAARRAVQFPVEVRPVEARQVEYAVRALGTVDVAERVQISARVAGVVDAVKFREGDVVAAGHVLVAIDAERYRLAERQARAAVDRVRVTLAEAASGLSRREEAERSSPGLIAGDELELWRNKLAAAKAELVEREVARDRAALDLRDAVVRAPIAGELESRTVVTGAYVQPGTVMATMVRREPLLLRFDVAEAESTGLTKSQAATFTLADDDHTYAAAVLHVGAVADPVSRMVKVTAQVTDPARARLRAGGFAQVAVPIGSASRAAVVPETAIRPSERGFLAYVIEGEVARERVLALGLRTADGLVEVKRGLDPGESLVVRGAEALHDGALVKIGGTPPGSGKGGGGPRSGALDSGTPAKRTGPSAAGETPATGPAPSASGGGSPPGAATAEPAPSAGGSPEPPAARGSAR